jgi:hypothetical protein
MNDFTKELNDVISLMLNDMSTSPIPYPEVIWNKEEIEDIEIAYHIYRVEKISFQNFKYIVERVMLDSGYNHIQSAQFVAQNINKLWQKK